MVARWEAKHQKCYPLHQPNPDNLIKREFIGVAIAIVLLPLNVP